MSCHTYSTRRIGLVATTDSAMQTPTVTAISPDQRDLALSVFTMAFAADPVMRWVFANAQNCLRAFPEFANAFGGGAIEQGTAYIADGSKGAAFWLPPGVESDVEGMGAMIAEYADESALVDAEGFMEQMARFHPDDANCWYLPIIGVDCAHQGQGFEIMGVIQHGKSPAMTPMFRPAR